MLNKITTQVGFFYICLVSAVVLIDIANRA